MSRPDERGYTRLWLGALAAAALFAIVIVRAYAEALVAPQALRNPTQRLAQMRRSGDAVAQRRFAWQVLAEVTQPTRNAEGRWAPQFESWQGEGSVFRSVEESGVGSGIENFARSSASMDSALPDAQSGGTPVIAYTLYNEMAADHIRRDRLYSRRALKALQSFSAGNLQTGTRSVGAFPASARVLKTIWWPVAKEGVTAIPIWDPEANPAAVDGNPYTSWKRLAAVDPAAGRSTWPRHVQFMGRRVSRRSRVKLSSFYHVAVDAKLAQSLMRDGESRRAALLALARPLQAGDLLILVGGNLATRELEDWIWIAFWWHDRASEGPFAAGRPSHAEKPWRNYLMSVAFDAATPKSVDGSPHICFNPWLEGRFPDNGNGGGISSNCIACHRRASFPPVAFLPVTRGPPDFDTDVAYQQDRLRTSLLWSLAMHAGP